MTTIRDLAEMIRDELDDAEKYAKSAIKHKDDDMRLAEMFYQLSRDELDHATKEHEQAVRLISESDAEPPHAMAAVWEWEHEHMIDRTERVRRLLEMYRS